MKHPLVTEQLYGLDRRELWAEDEYGLHSFCFAFVAFGIHVQRLFWLMADAARIPHLLDAIERWTR